MGKASGAPEKVLFVIPGVNSSIEDHHISATVRHAIRQGFNCVVVNPVRPCLKKGIEDLEVIDYSRVEPISESVTAIKDMFGEECQIYAIGYSLGSNHLLRHLGAHENCKEVCGIRAAVSISGAYDIRATCVVLKDRVYGLYDQYMLKCLQESFTKAMFRATSTNKEHYKQLCKEAKNLTHFDTLIRGPIFGYRGASRLFRCISCDAYVSQIETPTFALATKDDTITDFKFVPVDDLERNPNVILAILEKGGHCNLFFKDEQDGSHETLAPFLAMEFFEKAEKYHK